MTQEFVTLPREVVEQALKAMEDAGVQRGSTGAEFNAIESLRAAMDQPQNHVPDAGNMLQAGWKLVPLEPNCSMVLAGERSLEQHDFLRLDYAYRAMLDAAPNPPTVKESSTVEQPQSNQPAMTPIAQRKLDDLVAGGYTISGYSVYHEQKHQHGFVTGAGLVGWWKPEGVEYPQPQGKQEPVRVFFPRYTLQHGNDWVIDPAFLRRVLHSIEPYTPCEFTPNQEQIESVLLALEVIPSNIYTSQKPKREPLSDDDLCKVFPAIATYTESNKTLYRSIARAIEAAHNIK